MQVYVAPLSANLYSLLKKKRETNHAKIEAAPKYMSTSYNK